MNQLEKRDLYDKNKHLTGETIYKGEPIPAGRYIDVIMAFIRNSKGEFLIQKRSKQKDGKYGCTGGHTKSGETSIEGMISEIDEELGLKVLPNELELIYEGREDAEQVFFELYFLEKDIDISTLKLQEEEVESVEWCTISRIKELIENGEFLINHAEEVFRMLSIKNL